MLHGIKKGSILLFNFIALYLFDIGLLTGHVEVHVELSQLLHHLRLVVEEGAFSLCLELKTLVDHVEAIEEGVKQRFLEALEELCNLGELELLQEFTQGVIMFLIPRILVDKPLNKPIGNFHEYLDFLASSFYAFI